MNESQRNEGNPISTVLISGGSGFVGSHTVERFLSNGFRVRCILRPERHDLGWLNGSAAEIVRADLTNPAALTQAVAGVEFVVHVAGVTKARWRHDYTVGNVFTTKALLTASAQAGTVKKFTYLSSLAVAGPSPTGEPLTEEADCHPVSLYGFSKLEGERVVRSTAGNIPWTILRPPAVFGPRDVDILELFKWIQHGIRPIIGSARKTVSMVYAPELARAIFDATVSPRTSGETYFVADPDVFRFSELLKHAASFFGRRTISLPFPSPVVYAGAALSEAAAFVLRTPALLNFSKARDLLQNHWLCSPKKLHDHIGYQPEIRVFDALRVTYEWYRAAKWL